MSFSRTYAGLCIYHLFVWSNLNFLHVFRWIILPTQLCLGLYSFFANLLHSLMMWLIVSYLSPHSLHMLFSCFLSILALLWLILMALFCTTFRRDYFSLIIIIIIIIINVVVYHLSFFFFVFLFFFIFFSFFIRVESKVNINVFNILKSSGTF